MTSGTSRPEPATWLSGSSRWPPPACRPASTTRPVPGTRRGTGPPARSSGCSAPIRPGQADTSDAVARPAPRPAYSVLAHKTWAAAGIEPIGDWRETLRRAFPAITEAAAAVRTIIQNGRAGVTPARDSRRRPARRASSATAPSRPCREDGRPRPRARRCRGRGRVGARRGHGLARPGRAHVDDGRVPRRRIRRGRSRR